MSRNIRFWFDDDRKEWLVRWFTKDNNDKRIEVVKGLGVYDIDNFKSASNRVRDMLHIAFAFVQSDPETEETRAFFVTSVDEDAVWDSVMSHTPREWRALHKKKFITPIASIEAFIEKNFGDKDVRIEDVDIDQEDVVEQLMGKLFMEGQAEDDKHWTLDAVRGTFKVAQDGGGYKIHIAAAEAAALGIDRGDHIYGILRREEWGYR